MPVYEIKNADDLDKYIHGEKKYVLIDFYGSWCTPCIRFESTYKELSNNEKYEEIYFLKLDIGKNEELPEKYEIKKLPTFIILQHGDDKSLYEPITDVNKLEPKLESLFKKIDVTDSDF